LDRLQLKVIKVQESSEEIITRPLPHKKSTSKIIRTSLGYELQSDRERAWEGHAHFG